MPRIIGIRHQEKVTTEGEMRPTQFYILEDGQEPRTVEFEDVALELDWLVGKFVVSWRDVDPKEDVSAHGHKVKFGPKGEDESVEDRHLSQVKKKKVKTDLARRMPAEYDGVREDDIYVAMMGGSGHQLVAGLSARLEKLGGSGKVYQTPPIRMSDRFGLSRDKDKDPKRLLELFAAEPKLFYLVLLQDRKIADVKSAWALRKAAQKARIIHSNRLAKVAKMEAYSDPERYVGAGVEKETLRFIRGEENMDDLKSDESEAGTKLLSALEQTDIWNLLLSKVEGCYPPIAGGIISAIGDIRRFHTPWQLAKYCGVAVVSKDKDGEPLEYATIQRRRSGEFSGWQNDARRCLWNFATISCIYLPTSVWGMHLRRLKAKTLAMHPVPEQKKKDGKPAFNSEGQPIMRYTTGHIHKIAIWRLQTDFIWWIWREWGRIHKYGAPKDFRPPGNRATDIVTPDLAETPAERQEPVIV